MYKPNKTVHKKKIRPYTLGVTAEGEVIETLQGIRTFDDFKPTVKTLNVVHINNRVTIIHKPDNTKYVK